MAQNDALKICGVWSRLLFMFGKMTDAELPNRRVLTFIFRVLCAAFSLCSVAIDSRNPPKALFLFFLPGLFSFSALRWKHT